MEIKYEKYNKLIDSKEPIDVEGSLVIEDKNGKSMYYHMFNDGTKSIKIYPKILYRFCKKISSKKQIIKLEKVKKYNSRGRFAEEFDLLESTVFRLIALNDLDELLKLKLDNKYIKQKFLVKK